MPGPVLLSRHNHSYFTFSELDHDLLLLQINLENGPQIPIEDLTLIIVDVLDHAIPYPQRSSLHVKVLPCLTVVD